MQKIILLMIMSSIRRIATGLMGFVFVPTSCVESLPMFSLDYITYLPNILN